MTRKAKTPPPIDPIEQDFLDALERLEGGAPLEPKLAKQAKLGTLKINVSVVAQEAGHSRTLIGHEGCKYPRVRTRIMALKAPVMPTTNAETVIRHLREENAELRRKLAQRDTENAALMSGSVNWKSTPNGRCAKPNAWPIDPTSPQISLPARAFHLNTAKFYLFRHPRRSECNYLSHTTRQSPAASTDPSVIIGLGKFPCGDWPVNSSEPAFTAVTQAQHGLQAFRGHLRPIETVAWGCDGHQGVIRTAT